MCPWVNNPAQRKVIVMNGFTNIHYVVRFFCLLNALHVDAQRKILSDPHCCAAIQKFWNNDVEVNDSVVYHLYMSHSSMFPMAMLSEEISNAMSEQFNGERWSEYGRPTLKQIAAARRAERPVLVMGHYHP